MQIQKEEKSITNLKWNGRKQNHTLLRDCDQQQLFKSPCPLHFCDSSDSIRRPKKITVQSTYSFLASISNFFSNFFTIPFFHCFIITYRDKCARGRMYQVYVPFFTISPFYEKVSVAILEDILLSIWTYLVDHSFETRTFISHGNWDGAIGGRLKESNGCRMINMYELVYSKPQRYHIEARIPFLLGSQEKPK